MLSNSAKVSSILRLKQISRQFSQSSTMSQSQSQSQQPKWTMKTIPKTSNFTTNKHIKPDAVTPTPEQSAQFELNNPKMIHHARQYRPPTSPSATAGMFSWCAPTIGLPKPLLAGVGVDGDLKKREESWKHSSLLGVSGRAMDDLGLSLEKELSENDHYFEKIVSGEWFVGMELLEQQSKGDSTDSTEPEKKKDTPPIYPYSTAYAGYQFGEFAGQLGDGRVVNLFDIPTASSSTSSKIPSKYTLQLKGSGLTPFSRFADGKATIRSSIREYIISEALHGIGIPSTRALSLTSYPTVKAQRGSALEQCGVVARMSESWIRVGHFDFVRMMRDRAGLIGLCEFVLSDVFGGDEKKLCLGLNSKEVIGVFGADVDVKKYDGGEEGDNLDDVLGELTKYDRLYLEIVYRNAISVAYWHAYGFLNGVLNTDNTSILGLALDFGPFSFMDYFDPGFTSNHDDVEKRYSFQNTPSAIWFNMVRLGESMAELIGAGEELLGDDKWVKTGEGSKEGWEQRFVKRANCVIDLGGELYEKVFIDKYLQLVCCRLGIEPRSTDHTEVLGPMFEMLKLTKVDYNKFFTILQELPLLSSEFDYESASMKFISKSQLENLNEGELKVLKDEIESFLGVFKVRLQSENLKDDVRLSRAKQFNPLFVPRNWILQDVVASVENGEIEDGKAKLDKLMKMSSYPYDQNKWGSELKDLEKKWLGGPSSEEGESKLMMQCSCSS
ncbi:unnamed protein product [Ambrosiozyma monospora]|uniref:Unnamed protein product n=1 Tax=Ambrosiozyma monospora TaxID=43982 RepID=A0ACB5STS1_AMBMO|nr:unnamed protein product [Ambrosiozyma monospora]